MSEKITFSELVEKISAKTSQSEQSTNDFIHELAGIIESSLGAGEKISISGFGKFELKWIDEHKGRNPQTGDEITIPGQNKVVFKPYKALRQRVNKPFENLESQVIGDETESLDSDRETPVLAFEASATPTPQKSSPTSNQSAEDLIVERESPVDSLILERHLEPATRQPDYKPFVATTSKESENMAWVFEQKMQHRGKQEPKVQDESNFKWSYAAAAVIVLIALVIFIFVMNNQNEQQMAETTALPSQSATSQVDNVSDSMSDESTENEEAVPGESANDTSSDLGAVGESNEEQSSTFDMTIHPVAEGESLWTIAENEYGDPYLWPAIFEANKSYLNNPNQLTAGDSLDIPDFGDRGNLGDNARKMVALGYISVYDWILENQPDNARYYLWAAGSFSQEVLRDASDAVNEADLAFATQG
jgi:nucleoid DNA-binding protein